jgi:hypothetical protein
MEDNREIAMTTDAYWDIVDELNYAFSLQRIRILRECPCQGCQYEAKRLSDLYLQNFIVGRNVPFPCESWGDE